MFDNVDKVGTLDGELVRNDMNDAGRDVVDIAVEFVLAPDKEVTKKFVSQPVDTPKTLR